MENTDKNSTCIAERILDSIRDINSNSNYIRDAINLCGQTDEDGNASDSIAAVADSAAAMIGAREQTHRAMIALLDKLLDSDRDADRFNACLAAIAESDADGDEKTVAINRMYETAKALER